MRYLGYNNKKWQRCYGKAIPPSFITLTPQEWDEIPKECKIVIPIPGMNVVGDVFFIDAKGHKCLRIVHIAN